MSFTEGEGVLDLRALVTPLNNGEAGEGVDLRADYSATSPYQKLRDARNDARAEERAQDAVEGEAAVPQSWRDVKKTAVQCLTTSTKDLEIGCWLTESLVRLDGLPGLTDGALLLSGLIDNFWDHGFPRPDEEEGMLVRAIPLGGLAGDSGDGMLMQPLRRMLLFNRADGSPVSLYVWGLAESAAAIVDETRRKARIAAGAPVLSDLEAEARADVAGLRASAVAAKRARDAWTLFANKLDVKLGADAPPTRRVTEALDQMIALAERFGGKPAEDAAPPPVIEAAPTAGAPTTAGAAATVAGTAVAGGPPAPLRTREEAIKRLVELADFFRNTEPHSPLAYTLDDAVRRARMTLPELLSEILPDTAIRNGMLLALGIRISAEDMVAAMAAAPSLSSGSGFAALPSSPPPPPPPAAPPPPPTSGYDGWGSPPPRSDGW